MLKLRDSPCETPMMWRAPKRSSRVTCRPRPARCQAVADPIAPPPTTTVSRRTAMRSVCPSTQLSAGGVVSRGECSWRMRGGRPGCPGEQRELAMALYLIAFNDEWTPDLTVEELGERG